MAGTQIQFDVVSDSITTGLHGLAEFAADPFPFLDEIGGQLVTETQDRFDSGTAPDGSNWTVSQAAIDRQGLTLKESGNLSNTLSHTTNNTELTWGSNLVYAAIHQFGGDTGRNKATEIEANPYLGLSEADELMIDTEFAIFFGRAAGV